MHLWVGYELSLPIDLSLLLGIVMVEDCGWLFYVDKLDILRARFSVHGCDHGAIDFGMTWLDI